MLAWEFVDNPLVKRTMCIESIENTFEGIRVALAYGTEDKGLSIIPLAIKCLRFCANILRLHNSGLLCISPHYICSDNVCYVRCIEELVQYLKLFWDEFLNTMVLRAKQQEDKCWWLHSFYGLWLQTLVHRTIYSLRKEFGLPFENTWNHYHLALRLFAAASGGHSSYDPLVTSWSLDDLHDKPSTELSQMRFYYLAQKAFDTRQWKTSGIHSSYDYLARMIPSTPLESRTQQDKVMDEERKQEKTMFSSQQHSKPTSTRPREGSRGARRPRLFTLDDDSDDEDLYCQEPLPRKNIDLPHSALSRARNRCGAKRRANSPPIYTTGGGLSESGSAMTRSSLSIGMSPTFASYSADIGSGSPLRINTPTSIRSMHSLPRSPMIPDRSSYSSSTGFTGMNGTPLPYVSSHESLSTGLQSTSIASSNSWAIKFHMCSCCPKKPKKFETKEELRAHEAEKQYECSFCGNRFKSKNEAERHQNSLHVRRHSWSCSALHMGGFDRAFHDSTSHPGQADVCGYCGDEFMRSGGVGRSIRQPTEQDWDERLRHLQETHRFRECNSSKKFYRADHFRQHLKHSHASTTGKWTNMLENACMLEEEPPQPPNIRST
ncbi:hypothetical protein MGN70_006225 [Eutypa lata]|nr:hypothetical protein MGN70_006225 [Eutypa lata]